MTNAGTFDEWMADTNALIELIQSLGERKWDIREYESPHFSYSYDGNNWTYKYSRVLEPMEDLNGAIAAQQAATASAMAAAQSISGPSGLSGMYTTSSPSSIYGGYITAQAGVHHHGMGMSNSTRTTPGINHVIITTSGNNRIQSVQWIRKPNSGLVITSTYDSNFGTMAGGTVRASMLFLNDNKILVNNKIFSNDNPDAFNSDISGEEQHFRYLDLLHFREKYDGKLY